MCLAAIQLTRPVVRRFLVDRIIRLFWPTLYALSGVVEVKQVFIVGLAYMTCVLHSNDLQQVFPHLQWSLVDQSLTEYELIAASGTHYDVFCWWQPSMKFCNIVL